MKIARVSSLISALSLVAIAACAQQQRANSPLVTALNVQTLAAMPGLVNGTPTDGASQSVNVSVTLNKDVLLGQDFLYGADLQYSSATDSTLNLYSQSMALGHEVVHFRISGDELQLIADDKIHFPSAVNHPEELVSRFKILAQTAQTVTVSGLNSGVYLAEVYGGTTGGTSFANPSAQPPRDSWIRSFDFAAEGNYLLQQTSVRMSDGTLVEFMESIFPRNNLATGAKFEKFEMDPNDPVGASDGPVARYRYLGGNAIYRGEKQIAFAQHFDVSANKSIDWYVTPNIPDEDLAPVKQAVEGWNRYFKHQIGVTRDVMSFKGRLPDGIHIGDPRFNVINWDSVRVAGAAYETQASDPETGNQSHSLIYMPAAWLQIGMDYWKNGQYSDKPKNESVAPKALIGLGLAQSARLTCTRDLSDGMALMNSGRMSGDEIKNFSFQLLKQTLFHEVGHALGLAHNFKGSLSYDPKNPKTLFSTSIMDYNDFEIERGAFFGVDTADGPQLEYDRQAISALYNRGRDVFGTDETVPTCNDAEADTETSGVDPLCIRYDIQHDPTWSVDTAIARIMQSKVEGDTTLAEAIARAELNALDAATVSQIKDAASFAAAVEKTANSQLGALNYYYVGGKASLSRVVRTNLKSLLQFEDSVLPPGYNELEMRERAFNGLVKAISAMTLPADIQSASAKATASAIKALEASPYVAQHGSQARADLAKAKAALAEAAHGFEQSEASGLPKLRIAVLNALARHKAAPYYFGTLSKQRLDYETAIVGILADAVDATENTKNIRTATERSAAAKSLATYAGRLGADSVISAVVKKLNGELQAATSNDAREEAMTLLNALQSASESDAGKR